MDDNPRQPCRNVLRMVQELHLRGYQRLRIAPGMSASGFHWRCAVTPAANTQAANAALLREYEFAAHYTSGMERKYFDWPDAEHASPSRLAELFLERFPKIASAGKGSDWAYAGWYIEMLQLTYPDSFPIAYADYDLPASHLTCVGTQCPPVPLPPAYSDAQQPHKQDMESVLLIGVDGCRSGWLCVMHEIGRNELRATILPSFQAIIALRPRPTILTIDIPIGLPDRGARDCDLLARKALGPLRGRSVFSAPIRPVLRARDHAEASGLRHAVDGVGMTLQAFGILQKVREVDDALAAAPNLQEWVREVHPEVSFAEWAGQPLDASKASRDGRALREALIDAKWPGERQRLSRAMARGGWQADDLHDAFAALWTAGRIASGTARALPPDVVRDSRGLTMQIVA